MMKDEDDTAVQTERNGNQAFSVILHCLLRSSVCEKKALSKIETVDCISYKKG